MMSVQCAKSMLQCGRPSLEGPNDHSRNREAILCSCRTPPIRAAHDALEGGTKTSSSDGSSPISLMTRLPEMSGEETSRWCCSC